MTNETKKSVFIHDEVISYKKMQQLIFKCLLLAALFSCSLIAIDALGQTGQAIISGIVTDSGGASIPNAEVEIKNVATGVVITVKTNDTGYYEVRDLNPGNYQVAVTASGFEAFVKTGIVLLAEAHPSIDAPLKVGSASEVITVTDGAPLIETQSVSVGQVITSEEMMNLPNGQAPIWLAMLAPGVQSNLAQNFSLGGADPNFNGAGPNFGAYGRVGANEYVIDGAANMANERAQAINLSPDETAQSSIKIASYDAEVGHTYGITMTQTTKTGTNAYHGALRLRRYDLRYFAMQHFQKLNYRFEEAQNNCFADPGTPQCHEALSLFGWPGTHLNYGDAGIGGPVRIPHLFDLRDKLFFFVGVTIEAPNNASSQAISVPTAAEKTGNFSDLNPTAAVPAPGSPQAMLLQQAGCPANTPFYGTYQIYNPYTTTIDNNGEPNRLPFCNNTIPQNMIANLPLVKIINSSLPDPNLSGLPAANVNNYFYVPGNYNTYRTVSNRYDYALNNSNHLFFRWSRGHLWQRSQQFLTGGLGDQYGQKWITTGSLGWSHMFSNSTVFDGVVAATQWTGSGAYFVGLQHYTASSLGLPSYMDTYAAPNTQLPILSISGYQQIGNSFLNVNHYRILDFKGNITSVQGKHSIRGGAEWRQQNVAGGGPAQTSTSAGPAGLFSFDDTYIQHDNGSYGATYPVTINASYASFLLGVQTYAQAVKVPPTSESNPYYAFFVGDTWRVTRKLTIIPGIRYEYEYGPTEKHNHQIVGWDPNAPLTFASIVDTAYQTTLSTATPAQQAVLPTHLPLKGGPVYAGVNGASTRQWVNNYRVLPRLGIAYAINPRTVVRTGVGLYYDTLNSLNEDREIDTDGFSASTQAYSSGVFGADFVQSAPPITNPFPLEGSSRYVAAVGNALGADYYTGATAAIGIYDHHRVPARSGRFQFSVDRQIGNSMVLQVVYLASRTAHITMDGNADSSHTYSNGFITATAVPGKYFSSGSQPNNASSGLLNSTVKNPFYIANLSSLQISDPVYYNVLSKSGYVQQPNIQLANLIHPFPQLQTLRLYESIGTSQFQQVQGNLSKRMGRGLVANVSFQWNYQKDRDYFNNPYDTHPSVESSTISPPWRVTATWVYTLPFGASQQYWRSGWKSKLVGGFRLSGSFEDYPGPLLTFSTNGTASNPGNLFFIGDPNSIRLGAHNWIQNGSGSTPTVYGFNTAQVSATFNGASTTAPCSYTGTGFVLPSSTAVAGQCLPNTYNNRAFPLHVEGVRAQGASNWNMNIGRTLNPGNRVKVEGRMDVMNVFNHQRLAAVGVGQMNPASSQFGQITQDGGNGREMFFQVITTF